jgi:membrane-associated phospholipid phosphatase
MALLTFSRFRQDPSIFLTFLWGFILINLSRFISIGLFPLNAPADLIPIHDPISNHFYGPKFITKDLFFSGHTAAMFLMFLCLKKKTDKILALIATLFIGIAVLLQHVHYTMDVVMAPVITYFLWVGSKKIVNS